MIITEYEAVNKDSEKFWTKFSTHWHGESQLPLRRMGFTEIIQRIREDRKRENEEDARKAREEFPGEEFERNFWYIKSGRRRIYSKTADIARKYRELRGRSEPSEDE
jgi:hypothetical protein